MSNIKILPYKTDNERVLAHPSIYDCLVYDIETDSLDTETATVKFVGCYSYKYEKYYILHKEHLDYFQELVKDHRVLIGFNNKLFDGPIIENNGINTDYKVTFDCLQVLFDTLRRKGNREAIIEVDGKTIGELLPDRKLRTIARVLKFPVMKGDIDYRIFQKNRWTPEELKDIYKYLYLDVDITRRLFEFYVSYFESFTDYVDEYNIKNFNYIRSTTGSYAYSAFCHMAKLPFEFEDDPLKKLVKPVNHGGFVLPPQVDSAHGTVIYFDFSSLYPFIYFQCNLFTHSSPDDTSAWHGDGFFDVQGFYCSDKRGNVESILHDVYYKRLEYKRQKNPKQLSLKILMNSLYGISGNPVFKSLFDIYTPGDCTSIGRKCLQHARDVFESHDYKVIYGDTDSCFVHLPIGKTVNDAKLIAKLIVKDLQSHMPFPDSGFELKVDDVFSDLWLFGKKQYIGINVDKRLKIKGLPIKKHDASLLGQRLLLFLKPLILENSDIKFDRSFIKKLIDDAVHEDFSLVGRIYNVKSPDSYKSFSSLQFQIAQALGEGSHLLIPNSSLGPVGKVKKYCTVEDAEHLSVDDLFLDKVWKELDPFIKSDS